MAIDTKRTASMIALGESNGFRVANNTNLQDGLATLLRVTEHLGCMWSLSLIGRRWRIDPAVNGELMHDEGRTGTTETGLAVALSEHNLYMMMLLAAFDYATSRPEPETPDHAGGNRLPIGVITMVSECRDKLAGNGGAEHLADAILAGL